MSETSSDAESSCGWTIISNEGSDIETLGSEVVVEYGTELLERPLVEETKLQDAKTAASAAECGEESIADSLDDTLGEKPVETLCASETGNTTTGHQNVSPLSSSDHSDIVTLRDLKEDEHVEAGEEAATNEEFYLGTSCSSQYAFTAAETVFPVQQPAVTNSSSSEDEAGRTGGTVVRRRRLRKNTTSIVTEPEEEEEEEEEAPKSGQSEKEEEEDEEDDGEQEEQAEARPPAAALDGQNVQVQGSSILNKCILIALVVAISMGFGHFHGTMQIQERQKTVEKIRVNDLDGVRDLIHRHVREQHFINQRGDFGLDDLDDKKVISLLTEVIEKMKRENHELIIQQAHIQAQRDDLEMLLKGKAEERSNIVSQQQRLTAENLLLKNSLEREEQTLSTLQEELKNLRNKIRDWEESGAVTDSLLSENQRLKDQLEEEKELIRSFHGQREEIGRAHV